MPIIKGFENVECDYGKCFSPQSETVLAMTDGYVSLISCWHSGTRISGSLNEGRHINDIIAAHSKHLVKLLTLELLKCLCSVADINLLMPSSTKNAFVFFVVYSPLAVTF